MKTAFILCAITAMTVLGDYCIKIATNHWWLALSAIYRGGTALWRHGHRLVLSHEDQFVGDYWGIVQCLDSHIAGCAWDASFQRSVRMA